MTEAEDEENQVKDLSIPFPFPKAADHALNHVGNTSITFKLFQHYKYNKFIELCIAMDSN